MEVSFKYGLGLIFLIFCAKTTYNETIKEDEKCSHSDHSLYCTEIPKDLPDNVTHVYLIFDKITENDIRYRTGILDGRKWKAIKFLYTNEIDRFERNKPLKALSELKQLVIDGVVLENIFERFFKGLRRLKILEIIEDPTMFDYVKHAVYRHFEENRFNCRLNEKRLTGIHNKCRYFRGRQFVRIRYLEVLKFYRFPSRLYDPQFHTYIELFWGLYHLKHLHIEGLFEVNPNALARLVRLEKLSVTSDIGFYFETKSFAGLGRLKVLHATGVREIKPYSLASLKELKRLSITVTDNFFHDQSFAGLSNLEVLHLSGNGRIGVEIESITSAMRRLPNLMEFSLSDISIGHSRTLLNTYEASMKLRMLLDAIFSKPLTSLILYNIKASETFLFELLKYTGHKGYRFRAFHPFKRINATLCRPHKIENVPSHNASIKLNETTSTLQLQLPTFISVQETINITGIYAEKRNIDLKMLLYFCGEIVKTPLSRLSSETLAYDF